MSTTQYVDVNSTLQNLEEQAAPENYQAVREFVDHCAAEGISEVQQDRLVWSWKTLLQKFAPKGFTMKGASEAELKQLMAAVNRSDYAESTKVKFKTAVKKFYRIQNGGHEQPDKTRFFKVGKESSSVEREDLFTEDELKRLFRGFSNVRDRAFTMVLYESNKGKVWIEMPQMVEAAFGGWIAQEDKPTKPGNYSILLELNAENIDKTIEREIDFKDWLNQNSDYWQQGWRERCNPTIQKAKEVIQSIK